MNMLVEDRSAKHHDGRDGHDRPRASAIAIARPMLLRAPGVDALSRVLHNWVTRPRAGSIFFGSTRVADGPRSVRAARRRDRPCVRFRLRNLVDTSMPSTTVPTPRTTAPPRRGRGTRCRPGSRRIATSRCAHVRAPSTVPRRFLTPFADSLRIGARVVFCFTAVAPPPWITKPGITR